MKFVVLALLVVAAVADDFSHDPFDSSNAVRRSELPGFWDGKDFPRFIQASFSRTSRIVGGSPVVPHSANYVALLNVNFPFGIGLCGGSILSTRAILTAAHCLLDSQFTVVIVGVHNRHVNEPSQQRRTVLPLRYVLHPTFNARNMNGNVAIMHIDQALVPSPQVGIVTIPAAGVGDLYTGESVRSLGWGRVNNTGPTSSVLLAAFNSVITNELCAASFPAGFVVASTLCVETSTVGGQGACHADEGGVLDLQRPMNVFTQIGITSFFSPAGCAVGQPVGYSRMTVFRGWIIETMPPPAVTE
ncbi:brachyurin-like [Chironomus tepperi]|uniref:brachyurin-like n=1 Tax=Chironomus tepperi TaxID=113505 RepID=UPI00391F4135